MKFRREILLLPLLLTTGCERRIEMYDQYKHEAYEKSDFFADGRVSREPVPGTVARGFLKDDDHLNGGSMNGTFATSYPFPMTRADLERGRERYNIYCTPCHAPSGNGNGMIVQRGYMRPPSFHTELMKRKPIGHYYQAIAKGFGSMPSYAAQVRVEDRWRIVAYIQALQLSQQVPLGSLPADAQQQLMKEGQ